MAVADVLKDIGSGLEKGAKVAGTVAQETLPDVLDPERGYENRQRQYQQEDQAIEVKASELQKQLDAGRTYGTLTPQQQQQLVDQITGLYSHPRHAPKLMEKLRQIIHPNGAVAQAPMSESLGIPAAFPGTGQGGTAAVDADNKAASKPRASSGTSPAITGNFLPPDATGPDGNPISAADRAANRQWKQWGRDGNWYPLAAPKGVFKVQQNRLVLLDPSNGSVIKDLGPYAAGKVTSHETQMVGDDGQMHLVKTYSYTSPTTGEVYHSDQNPTAEVEPTGEETHAKGSGGATTDKPKSAPKKTTVADALKPPSGAKEPGRPVPGSNTAAASKDPMYKAQLVEWAKLDTAAKQKNAILTAVLDEQKNPSATGDQELVFNWVRANVQGAGRMTNTEIQQAYGAASWYTKIQNTLSRAATGMFIPEFRNSLVTDIKRSADAAKQEADNAKPKITTAQSSSAPAPASGKKWSKSKWLAANPGGDVNAAAERHKAKGDQVVD